MGHIGCEILRYLRKKKIYILEFYSYRMKIQVLPNILCLHLKRFKFQEALQKYVKLSYRVLFPMELRLFNTVDDMEDPDRIYDLNAFVVHVGSGPHHGHYVAVVKHNDRWLLFDDETVEVSDSKLNYKAGKATMAFWMKVSTELVVF